MRNRLIRLRLSGYRIVNPRIFVKLFRIFGIYRITGLVGLDADIRLTAQGRRSYAQKPLVFTYFRRNSQRIGRNRGLARGTLETNEAEGIAAMAK